MVIKAGKSLPKFASPNMRLMTAWPKFTVYQNTHGLLKGYLKKNNVTWFLMIRTLELVFLVNKDHTII